uniref:Uncharacterized protein n=1 Tax=Vibrio tasmaniensis TaxID=212663 RepID=A0A0H3ZK62_9VIBR|nr:hypothetical protein [Vibrio tasmaniensis]
MSITFMEPLGCPYLKQGSSLQGREAFIYPCREGSDLGGSTACDPHQMMRVERKTGT